MDRTRGRASSQGAGRRGRRAERALLDELALLIVHARRVVRQAAASAVERHGESFLPFQVLAFIVREEGASQSDLAALSGQHPAGVSRTVDDLERAGLVERRRDEADRRRVLVVATARGRARHAAVHPAILDAVESALAPLDHGERQALRALLRKILAAPPPRPESGPAT